MNLDEAREQAKKLLGEIKPSSGRGLTEVGRDEHHGGNPFDAMTRPSPEEAAKGKETMY